MGCGTGAVMEQMAARGGGVTGIDLDAELGEKAAAACGGRFVTAYVEKDDDAVAAGGFDLVYGRLILPHVADPAACCAGCGAGSLPVARWWCRTTTCAGWTAIRRWPSRAG